jgi:hypothetical protein
MTARERASQYIAIFINVGEKWRGYVPVDGERTERGIRIDGIEVWPNTDGTWLMQDGDQLTRFAAAVKP